MGTGDPSTREVEDRLHLLVIFHYVVGGLACVMGLIPVIHLVIGILALNGGFAGEQPPRLFGIVFVTIGAVAILLAQAMGMLAILSGRRIARRRDRNFSLVVACILCLFVPFGTVLGIFTLLLLTTDAYRSTYDRPDAASTVRRRRPPGERARALR